MQGAAPCVALAWLSLASGWDRDRLRKKYNNNTNTNPEGLLSKHIRTYNDNIKLVLFRSATDIPCMSAVIVV